MKVVLALNAPDVRHEITLLGGVWEPPAQGKGGINRKAPRKGVCQKGLGVFCTRGKGELKHGTPVGTLHLRILNRLDASLEAVSRSVEVGAEERETGALHCFSSSHTHVVCVCFFSVSLFSYASTIPCEFRGCKQIRHLRANFFHIVLLMWNGM